MASTMSPQFLQPLPSANAMRGSAPFRGAPPPQGIVNAWAVHPRPQCPHLTTSQSSRTLSGIALSSPPSGPAKRCTPSVHCRATPGMLRLPLDRDTDEPLTGFDSIRSALDDLAAGKFVVVLDDEDRENEGDLIIAADKVTPEAMHYMVEHTSGVICISMEGRDLDRLRLPLMVNSAENEEAMSTAFTVTVDLKEGISTGISASDRSKTIRRLSDPSASAADFNRPGHIFPLRYRPGGVLVRPGHTEAGVDLARLAGCYPAGVLCEIVDRRDGSMARTPLLMAFAKEQGLKCITIADLIRYRLRHERLVIRTATATLQTPAYGTLTVHTYRCALDDSEHLVVKVGQEQEHGGNVGTGLVPVHIHHESCVEDILGASPLSVLSGGVAAAAAAEAGGLHSVLGYMAAEGKGVLVYMRPRLEGRPSLAAELQALSAADVGNRSSGIRAASGVEADLRVYGLAAQMLKDVGIAGAVMVGEEAEVAGKALAACGLAVQTRMVAAVGARHQVNGNGHSNGVKSSMATSSAAR